MVSVSTNCMVFLRLHSAKSTEQVLRTLFYIVSLPLPKMLECFIDSQQGSTSIFTQSSRSGRSPLHQRTPQAMMTQLRMALLQDISQAQVQRQLIARLILFILPRKILMGPVVRKLKKKQMQNLQESSRRKKMHEVAHPHQEAVPLLVTMGKTPTITARPNTINLRVSTTANKACTIQALKTKAKRVGFLENY